MNAAPDDYDSPWKDAVERYLTEFLAFFFPAAYAAIDWSQGYAFLDQELHAGGPGCRTRAALRR